MRDEIEGRAEITRSVQTVSQVFLGAEMIAYVALGTLLVLTTLLALGSTIGSLWTALLDHGLPGTVVGTIDHLLFVLMLVEILHTVRVSFRSGSLLCEPFLVVGLIASIRRILVITLKTSQGGGETQNGASSTMVELVVLGVLILVMVVSIVLLRRNRGSEAVDLH